MSGNIEKTLEIYRKTVLDSEEKSTFKYWSLPPKTIPCLVKAVKRVMMQKKTAWAKNTKSKCDRLKKQKNILRNLTWKVAGTLKRQ